MARNRFERRSPSACVFTAGTVLLLLAASAACGSTRPLPTKEPLSGRSNRSSEPEAVVPQPKPKQSKAEVRPAPPALAEEVQSFQRMADELPRAAR